MRGELVDDGAGESHRAPGGARLRLPEDEPALDLDEDLGHLDAAGEQVHSARAQASELADAETAIRAEKNQGPVARMDGAGQAVNFLRPQKAHLLPLDLR